MKINFNHREQDKWITWFNERIFSKQLMIFLVLCLSCKLCYSQKKDLGNPPLELTDFNQWEALSIQNSEINEKGTFVTYYVKNEHGGGPVLHVHSLIDHIEVKFENITSSSFINYGAKLVMLTTNGNLLLRNLITKSTLNLSKGIKNFKILNNKNGEFIICSSGTNDDLTIYDVKGGLRVRYENVKKYYLSRDFKYLALVSKTASNPQSELKLIDLLSLKVSLLSRSNEFSSFCFGENSTNMAFTCNMSSQNGSGNSIFTYKVGQNYPKKILDDALAGLPSDHNITDITALLNHDKHLMFEFKEIPKSDKLPSKSSVKILSYNAENGYQSNLESFPTSRGFSGKAIFSLDKKRVMYRQTKDQDFTVIKSNFNYYGLITVKTNIRDKEFFVWLPENGNQIKLAKAPDYSCPISPDGKHLILSDEFSPVDKGRKLNNLYSYHIATGKIDTLTAKLSIPSFDLEFKSTFDQRNFSIVGVIDNNLFIRDNYDIWKCDISGKNRPVNVTNGFGRRNKIAFNIPTCYYQTDLDFASRRKDLNTNAKDTIILTSYDYTTANNDYYKIALDKSSAPIRLTKGGYCYNSDLRLSSIMTFQANTVFKKAKRCKTYLISKQNSSESPNLYITSNFRSYQPVSDIRPERKFNWLTSEMINFKNHDGNIVNGVLFKPQNFDINKKYPIIIHFYQRLSQNLHVYKQPQLSNSDIDIPYYVSNGYLVFTPDIDVNLTKGQAASDALKILLNATDVLIQKPYVDSTKMAIQGYSWSGFLCNYFVTHTNRFAAAVSGGGHSDMIGESELPTRTRPPRGNLPTYDHTPGNIFNQLNVFIANSPVLFANKVTTPLLLMHNKMDDAVPYHGSLTFFFTLSRQKKRAWLLTYEGENHGISRTENQIDYTIRVKQFLDHYLKDVPAPKWMTQGRSDQLKGSEDGLLLDLETKTPQIQNY